MLRWLPVPVRHSSGIECSDQISLTFRVEEHDKDIQWSDEKQGDNVALEAAA